MSYKIITVSGTGTTATLVLNDVGGLEVGVCILIYNTGNNKLDNKRHQIATIDVATDTITFDVPSLGTVAAFNPPNATLVPLVTWVKAEDVELFLGFEADGADLDYLEQCTNAANEFGYRRRQSAGYNDSRCLIPNPAAFQGVQLYAAALYRERGSIDSFQSFGDQTIPGMVGSMGQIMRLLGINRPAVG